LNIFNIINLIINFNFYRYIKYCKLMMIFVL